MDQRTAIGRAIAAGVFIQLLFAFFFIFPGHDPAPNGLPIGVIAEAGAAEALAAELEAQDDGLDVRTFTDAETARDAIADREIYGGLVAPQGRPSEVLISSAQSAPVATLLERIGEAAGATRVTEVTPLAEGDSRGTTLNLLVLPVIVTSILGALLAVQLVPRLRTPPRIASATLVGVLAGLGVVGLVHALDALPGPYLAEVGLLALAVIGIALTAAGLIRLIGPPGIFLAFVVFLMLGNPASGLGGAPELLPTPWAELGPFLPPGALGSALRGAAYFDGAGVVAPTAVLVGWIAVGAGLNLVADRRDPGAVADAPGPA